MPSFKKSLNMTKLQRRQQLIQQRANKMENLFNRYRMEGGANRSPYLTVY